MKKKIVILTSAHLASDVRIYEKEARSLSKYYDVTLIAPIHESFIPRDIAYVPLKNYKSRINRTLNVIKCFYFARRAHPYIVHIHDAELLPVALLLRWLFGIHIVYDIHENQHKGILNKEWLPVWMRKTILFLFSQFESFALRWMSGIILAEYSYNQVYNGRCANLQVVRNYPIFVGELTNGVDAHRENKEEIVIGYVGAIQQERGIFEMIELIREFKTTTSRQVTLEIMGSFASDQLKEKVVELIKLYNIRDSIVFHGRLTYGEFLRVLSKADIGLVFLHPTSANMEIIPTKLYEYMMLKIPIIVMDIPILKEFVAEVKCGIVVDAFDSKDTAKKIIDLINDPAQRKTMGFNGYTSIKENYNWEREEDKLLQLYNNI